MSFWFVHNKNWIQWFNGFTCYFWTFDTKKTSQDSDHFIKEKLRPQDGTMGETICSNNMPDKLERMQLKLKKKSLDWEGEKKRKAE